MFLVQDLKQSTSYKAGYEVGYFIGSHPVLSTILGIIVLMGIIWGGTKIIKQIRTFGE